MTNGRSPFCVHCLEKVFWVFTGFCHHRPFRNTGSKLGNKKATFPEEENGLRGRSYTPRNQPWVPESCSELMALSRVICNKCATYRATYRTCGDGTRLFRGTSDFRNELADYQTVGL